MQDIRIGSAVTNGPGQAQGWLKLADNPDGSPMQTPVVIVTGSRPGPTVWVHACVHGNEYCGTKIVHALLRSLDPRSLAGRVVALPALNISAFNRNQRTSPFEGYGGGDMNRAFPGVEAGSLTQQMAFRVYRELKAHADVLVDFHTAHTADVRWAIYAAGTPEVAAQGEKIARAWGYRDTLAAPAGMLTGSALSTAAGDGIPAFIVECGGKFQAFDGAAVADGAKRFANVLRALGMLEGAVEDHGPIANFTDFAWVHAPRGGLFRPAVRCGERLERGTVLGTYFTLWGDADGDAISPHAGTVLAIHPGPIMVNGDTLVHIGLHNAR
jgi:predicted deacylase